MKLSRAKETAPGQGDLFGIDRIAQIYQDHPSGEIDNKTLYAMLASKAGIPSTAFDERVPIGHSGQKHNLARRKIRWGQQSLKHMGILCRVKGERGIWRLTEEAKKELNAARPRVKVLGFRTDLGVAVLGNSTDIFSGLNVEVNLVVTSPPYSLARPRRYGNVPQQEIVSFIMETLEPLIEKLAEDGSLVVNTSQDIFLPNSPARSTYLERLVIALEDRGLFLMDRICWANPSKAPGPLQWASKTRQQLNVAWEPILWFARNPIKVKSNNRRVLEPHSERHLRLIADGGERRDASYCDGAYRLKPGSFGAPTEGKIPRNVLMRGHRCAYGLQYNQAAKQLGLPVHGAGQPLAIADFLIRFLTEEGDLCVDPFGGRMMTGLAAELLNRTWMCGELMLQYVRGGAELFRSRPGFYLNPQIEHAFNQPA